MAAAKTAPKPAASPFATVDADVVPGAKRSGAGRPENPRIRELIGHLEPLPFLKEDDGKVTGWQSANVPDVSTFIKDLRNAGTKMDVSFKVRHEVTVTDDDQDNPGVVFFVKIPRTTRERKAKTNGK